MFLLGILLLAGTATRAGAHEFQIHDIAPSDDWCAEVHAVAVAGDLLQLRPGVYPGGCDLTLGGHLEDNEALAVHGDPGGGTVVAADPNGLSLRISGEATRLYLVTAEGTVQVTASGTTIDRSEVACLDVAPGLDRVTVLFSTLDELSVDVGSAVLRGNQLGTVDVVAVEGLVHENTVHGDLHSTVPAERNLVLGDLEAVDAISNLVLGDTQASGELFHNTLLGRVDATGSAANNLTATTALPAKGRNLLCPTCLVAPDALDLQPDSEALTAPILALDPPVKDYCGRTPEFVGAVGLVGASWTAHDRDLFGCEPGMVPEPPTSPAGFCALLEPADSGTPAPTEPQGGSVTLEDSGGCSTARVAGWTDMFRRRRPR